MTSLVMNLDIGQNRSMRAARLVSILLTLQRRGRVTARYLAEQLEVSQRTVLRDIEELAGAGVPIYATRGPGGGFELLEGYRAELPVDELGPTRRGRPPRGRAMITEEGRRLAAVLGKLQPLRIFRTADDGRLEATFPIRSNEAAIIDVLSLGHHVEIVEPAPLRAEIARRIHLAAARYETTPDDQERASEIAGRLRVNVECPS
jgi:predicted DNA-binding transcriptional regulator YafY